MNEKQRRQAELFFEAMIIAQTARKVYQEALTNLAKITRDLEMEAQAEAERYPHCIETVPGT